MANWVQVADQLNSQLKIISSTIYNGEAHFGTYGHFDGGRLFKLNATKDSFVEVCPPVGWGFGYVQNIHSIALFNNNIYAGIGPERANATTVSKLNVTEDAWHNLANATQQIGVASVISFHGRLWVAGYTSDAQPHTWPGRLQRLNLAEDGFDIVGLSPSSWHWYLSSLCIFEDELYLSSSVGRIAKLNSTEDGLTNVFDGSGLIHLIVWNGRLWGASETGYLYRLNLAKDSFDTICTPLDSQGIFSVAVFSGNNKLYAGTSPGGFLYVLNDAQDSWVKVCDQLNGQDGIYTLISFENSLYAGTGQDGRLFEADGLPLPPIAEFSAIPLSGVFPLSVQFTDLSTQDPTEWLWEFGDSESSTDQNPEHTYQNIGKYTVTLTATSSLGFDVLVKTDYITVRGSGIYLVKNGNNGNAIENSIVISHNNASLEFATTDTPIGDMVYNLITYNYGAGNFNITNPVSNVISSQPNTDPLFTNAELAESSFDIGDVMSKAFLPQKTSPVFDNGDNQFISNIPIDIIGNNRVYISGVVDIGPYEVKVHQLNFTSDQIKKITQDKLRIDHVNKRFTPAVGDDIYNDLWWQFVVNPENREEFSRESKIIIKMKTVWHEFNKSIDKFDTPLAEYEAYYDDDKMSIVITKTDDFFGNMVNSIFDDGRYVFFFSEVDSKFFVYINPTYNKGKSGKTNIVNGVRAGGLSIVNKQ